MVCNGIVYLKTEKRMPVRLGKLCFPRDVQQDIPAGWCALCRRELYNPRQQLCKRCKGVMKDDE